MNARVSKRLVMGFTAAFVAIAMAATAGVTRVVVGSVEKVDKAARTITVKTVDGAIDVLRFTEKTTIHGAKDAASVADLAGRDTSHFVVHYTGAGVRKTATSLEFVGDGVWKAAKGTLVRLEDGGRKVVMRTADDAEWVFDAGEHAAIKTGRGLEKLGADAGESLAQGAKVTIHYSESGGKKIAHFVDSVGRA